MGGYEVDVDALAYGIDHVVKPALEHADELAKRVQGFGDLGKTDLTGLGALSGVALDAVCLTAGAQYEQVAADAERAQRKLVETLELFGDSLRLAVRRYQDAEAQHSENLQRLAHDLGQ